MIGFWGGRLVSVRALLWASFVGIALIAGCGGGGGGSSSPPTTTATMPPSNAAPTSPFSATSTFTVQSTSEPVVIPMPAVAGFSGQAAFYVQNLTPQTQITETLTSAPPPGIPPFSISRRSATSERGALDAPAGTVFYICYSSTSEIVMYASTSFTIVLPPNYMQSGVDYYLAILAGTQWEDGYGGTGAIDGSSVTFSGGWALSISTQAPTCLALYAQSAALPAPTQPPAPSVTAAASASPTPTPTPSPSPTSQSSSNGNGGVGITLPQVTAAPIVAQPPALIFAQSGLQQTVVLSEAGYGGTFYATSSNASVAAATVGRDGFGDYILTVQSVGAGTCTISLSSNNGGTGSIAVSVGQ